jgi:predicted dehydrogenase
VVLGQPHPELLDGLRLIGVEDLEHVPCGGGRRRGRIDRVGHRTLVDPPEVVAGQDRPGAPRDAGAAGAAGAAARLDQRLTLVGEHGALELDGPFRAAGPATGRLEVDGRVEVLSLPSDDCFRREIEHFGAVVRGTAEPAVPLDDSARWLAVAETVDALVRSSSRLEDDEAAVAARQGRE